MHLAGYRKLPRRNLQRAPGGTHLDFLGSLPLPLKTFSPKAYPRFQLHAYKRNGSLAIVFSSWILAWRSALIFRWTVTGSSDTCIQRRSVSFDLSPFHSISSAFLGVPAA